MMMVMGMMVRNTMELLTGTNDIYRQSMVMLVVGDVDR
jgi:hypothetical protein